MKTKHKKKPLTLGEFIMSICDTCDEQRASVIVWLAIKTRLVSLSRARLPNDILMT